MATSAFECPAIHSFPPFFTQQPTADTWNKQRQLWCELVLAHSQHHRVFIIDADEVVGKAAPFHNPAIRRSLPRETVVLVLEHLVSALKCGEWENKDRTRCWVFWRKPDEWASLIYKWIFDTGRTNTVCTTFEIIHGDESADESFHELPEPLLMRALDVLVKQGKAQIFNSSDGNAGVKFI
ncbi:hypothetical protein HK105_205785 [Polyrhizophydium stewartii]|uniref:Uncharacterized protein n=1 Tax=Polyrhizophydium stewartii TaxID=2732419 RepID=A0ABR4N530_9FUNG